MAGPFQAGGRGGQRATGGAAGRTPVPHVPYPSVHEAQRHGQQSRVHTGTFSVWVGEGWGGWRAMQGWGLQTGAPSTPTPHSTPLLLAPLPLINIKWIGDKSASRESK